MITCSWCGSTSEAELPPLTWASSVEAGVVRYYCERCARENARSIESRLDTEYW
jgi:hypothetical protein